MISPSESLAAPVRLLGGALQDGAAVSRLEFHPVERVREEPVVAVEEMPDVETEVSLMDEVDAVDPGLELQAQVEAARREARAEAREEWEEELEEQIAVERARMSAGLRGVCARACQLLCRC